jgi:hypothetical protein
MMGSEFVPYYDPETGDKFYIDVGFSGEYQAEGRDYSELFDALAGAGQDCLDGTPDIDQRGLPNVACFNPDSNSSVAGFPHDGITTVEEFLSLEFHVGLGVYLSNSARIAAGLSLAHETEHFISRARPGIDLNGNNRVDARGTPEYNPEEQNPTYVAAIDAPGRRLRVEETTVFTAGISLSFILDSLKQKPSRPTVATCRINNDCPEGNKCCGGACTASSSSCAADEGDARLDN